jgi:hypothetical protein
MDDDHPSQEGYLEFLRPQITDGESFVLSSGEQVLIQKYFLNFKKWDGQSIPNTYGNKTVINLKEEPVFAELAVLRLFQDQGWEGVWVDSYRRKYRVGLPDISEPVELPGKQKQLLENIKSHTGENGGCWDVFVWKNDQVLFIELKRFKKDRIQSSQNAWLEASLVLDLKPENFALIEWDLYK